jgi:hypothetical protein
MAGRLTRDDDRLRMIWMLPAGLLLTLSITACGASIAPGGGLADRPENPNAIAPIAILAQGSGEAGEFRIWAYHTSEGMACIELATAGGATSACDPTGRPPVGGSGVNRNARGVVVWANTGEASATTAIVVDASGASLNVALIDAGPTVPGVKVAVANLGSSRSPVAIDFLNAAGSKVDSVRLR